MHILHSILVATLLCNQWSIASQYTTKGDVLKKQWELYNKEQCGQTKLLTFRQFIDANPRPEDPKNYCLKNSFIEDIKDEEEQEELCKLIIPYLGNGTPTKTLEFVKTHSCIYSIVIRHIGRGPGGLNKFKETLSAINQNPNIFELYLIPTSHRKNRFKALCEFLKTSKYITTLVLSNIQFDNRIYKWLLEALIHNKNIEILRLHAINNLSYNAVNLMHDAIRDKTATCNKLKEIFPDGLRKRDLEAKQFGILRFKNQFFFFKAHNLELKKSSMSVWNLDQSEY